MTRSYCFYVDDDRYSVPNLYLVEAANLQRAVELARRLLQNSPHHLGVEICEGDEWRAGIGSLETSPLDPSNRTGPSAKPAT